MSGPTYDLLPWRLLDPGIAAAITTRFDEIADEIADGVTRSVPEFADSDSAKNRRDIDEAVTVALRRFVQLIGTDEAALSPEASEVFVGIGAAEAREARGPQVLFAALRAASRLMLRELVDAVARHGAVSTDAVIELSDAVTVFVDEILSATTEGFARRVRELAGEHDRGRARLAELLIAGGASDAVLSAALAAVGWPSISRAVPVVLPLAEAREARFRFGGDGLVVDRVDHVLTLVRDAPRTDREHLAARLSGRSAVVGPWVDVAELPEAVQLTVLASRLLVPPGPAPVFVDDHLSALALRGEPWAMEMLARHRLAPFRQLPPGQREHLLGTLRSWLRHWGARAAVAEELFVHPQTVSYRMRRVRALLGDSLDEPTTRFELALALAARAHD